MPIDLDHMIVPSKDRVASAKRLAELLGVRWAPQSPIGPFSPVYVNDGLTLAFDQWTDNIPQLHYCFRVDHDMFNAVLDRIKATGIAY